MMKVRLLKDMDHLKLKSGDTTEVSPEMAAYWFRMGVAEEAKEVKPIAKTEAPKPKARKKK